MNFKEICAPQVLKKPILKTYTFLMIVLASYTFSTTAQADNLKIGMVNFFFGADYFKGMDVAVHREAEKSGVEVISTDAGFDIVTMAAQIDELLEEGVDGLIISAGPTETLFHALKSINRAGVPVVFVDRLWSDTQSELKTHWNWVGAQNTVMGSEIGKYIGEYLKGTGKVAIIRGGPEENSIGLQRTSSFKDAIGKNKGIEIVVANGFGGWAPDGGERIMKEIMKQHSDLAAVFCENDAMCLGARKAAMKAGKNSIVFGASDAGKETLKAMMEPDSSFIATAVNDSDEIGRVGFENLMKLLKGESLPKLTPLDSNLVTRDQASSLYDPNKVF